MTKKRARNKSRTGPVLVDELVAETAEAFPDIPAGQRLRTARFKINDYYCWTRDPIETLKTEGHTAMAQPWEYKIVKLKTQIKEDATIEFNTYGADDWELVQILQTSIAIFKRPSKLEVNAIDPKD